MISLEKLSQITKFKERDLSIPVDNRFIQPNAIQMKVNEMNKQLENIKEPIIKHSIESEFVADKMEIIDVEEPSYREEVSNFVFEENEILNIPVQLNSLSLEQEQWYLYGTHNPNSFYKALLYLHDSSVMLKSNGEKMKYVSTFLQEMAIMTDSIYMKYNYKSAKFNKRNIRQTIMDGGVDYPATVLSADYVKHNLCIVDMILNKYQIL